MADREHDKIYLGGCDIEWLSPVINATGVALDGDDAVVFSLYASDLDTDDENGTVVTGASAITMTFRDPKFVGALLASVALTRDAFYWLEVTATPDGGAAHTRRSLVKAVDRGFNP